MKPQIILLSFLFLLNFQTSYSQQTVAEKKEDARPKMFVDLNAGIGNGVVFGANVAMKCAPKTTIGFAYLFDIYSAVNFSSEYDNGGSFFSGNDNLDVMFDHSNSFSIYFSRDILHKKQDVKLNVEWGSVINDIIVHDFTPIKSTGNWLYWTPNYSVRQEEKIVPGVMIKMNLVFLASKNLALKFSPLANLNNEHSFYVLMLALSFGNVNYE